MGDSRDKDRNTPPPTAATTRKQQHQDGAVARDENNDEPSFDSSSEEKRPVSTTKESVSTTKESDVIRAMIQHEDKLRHSRMNWFVFFQGLLWAAYSLLYQTYAFVAPDETMYTKYLKGTTGGLLIVISLLGLYTSFILMSKRKLSHEAITKLQAGRENDCVIGVFNKEEKPGLVWFALGFLLAWVFALVAQITLLSLIF